jgi:malonyl-CoA O-methyltransferase
MTEPENITPVGRRFGLQANRYGAVSGVQGRLADLLWTQTQPYLPESLNAVIEIGPGTGHLSRRIASAKPQELHLLDLSPEMLAQSHHRLMTEYPDQTVVLHQGDAEYWTPHGNIPPVTLVASSATVQWFQDLPAFFHRMVQWGTPQCTFALATFGPQTLRELHEAYRASTGNALTPGTRMHSASDLASFAEQAGLTVVNQGKIMHKAFHDSPRAMLADLKSMGVTGGNSSKGISRISLLELETRLWEFALAPGGQIQSTWDLVWLVAKA